PRLSVDSFDGPLGRNIIDTHIWAVHQGLRGASAYELFDGYCQRLVIHGEPLWRAQAGMQTLHPQWGAYSYLWRRDLNAIQPEQHARSDLGDPQWLRSPLYDLIRRANAGENSPSMRRRLDAGPEQRDFAVLDDFFSQGATDYFAQLFEFGENGDPSQGSGAIYSRHGPAAIDPAGTVAGDESARESRDRLGIAANLSGPRDETTRSRGRDRARFGRDRPCGALVCRHSRLYGDERCVARHRRHRSSQQRVRGARRGAALARRR